MKRIFVIDWILIVVFIVSAISGFGLHVAGHGSSHEIWHNWAVFHVLGSILFLIAVIFHVAMHLEWYKGIIKKGIGSKSKVTAVLSFIFLLLSVTGLALLWHYKIGVITIVIALGHVIKRLPVFRKSLNCRM